MIALTSRPSSSLSNACGHNIWLCIYRSPFMFWVSSLRSLAKAQHGQKSRCHRCSISCQELPPPQYFPKGNSIKPMDSFLPKDAIPMIDISLLSSSSLSSKGDDELQKLKLALTSWCCFEVLVSTYLKIFYENI